MTLLFAMALILQVGGQADRPGGTEDDRQGSRILTPGEKSQDPDRPLAEPPGPERDKAQVDDGSLAQQVRKFAGGDDAPRTRLLAAGPASMRLLWPYRNQTRVRTLMREIRRTAASPGDQSAADRLAGCRPAVPEGLTTLSKAVAALGITHYTFDPCDSEALRNRVVPPIKGGTALELLECACAGADVDFAFLYGLVLVASPERLWPPPPQEFRELTQEERRPVKALVAALGAETLEERERATNALLGMGPAIIPVLEESTLNPDAEISGRCREIVGRLKPKDTWVFAMPAVEKQSLTGANATLYAGILRKEVTYKVQSLTMGQCLKLLLDQFLVDVRGGSTDGKNMNYSFEAIPVISILAVITQANGLDYMLENGKVVVGPREDIRRRVALGDK